MWCECSKTVRYKNGAEETMVLRLIKKYVTKELIVYGIVGGMTTVVNFIVSYLMNDVIGCTFTVITNSVAWVAAVAFAYVANNTWVFRLGFEGWKKEVEKIWKFTAGRIATWVIEVGGMYRLVDCMELAVWPIKIALAVIVILLNYVFSKLFVFIKKKEVEE